MTSGSPFVDYTAVADRYAVERAVPRDVLASWRRAAVSQLVRPPAVVADIGSGTGIFTRAWADWTHAQVVGVEPATAMLQSAASLSCARVSYLRGLAEALPLADARVDAVWVSAAFHHFVDQRAAAREMARVLTIDGRVFLRGVVRDLTPAPWLDAFPGRHKALARYPSLAELRTLFAEAALDVVDTREVQESARTNGERADWIERMRDADSILTALTDDEIAAGVHALRRSPDDIVPVSLTLVTFSREQRVEGSLR
jgi:ubiquinone/menaquinone biosynthesis C-methylase UbiE